MTATSGSDTVAYVDGAEGVFGTDYSDNVYGDGGRNILHGGAGDDYVDGGSGDDLISGGAGLDYVYGGAGKDVVIDLDGGDTIYGGTGFSQTTELDADGNVIKDNFVVGQGTTVGDFDLSPDGAGLSGRSNQVNDIVFVQVTAAHLAAAGFTLTQIYDLVTTNDQGNPTWREFVKDVEIEVLPDTTTVSYTHLTLPTKRIV